MQTAIKKLFEDNFLKTLSIPLAVAFIGTLIINTNLSQYNVTNYNIFQSKSLFVGGGFYINMHILYNFPFNLLKY